MARSRVLLLEDDPNLGLLVQEHLQMNDYDVTLCVNGEEGNAALARGAYDLCLVDVMMPKKDGFTFARELREHDEHMPLIFLTAKSLKEDRIEGFRIGCDDYITKPFSVEELLLRIQAVLKRSRGPSLRAETPTVFEIGEYSFDSNRQLLMRGDKQQKLTPRETDLLRLLCLNMNEILPRDEALKKIWGDENYFHGRSMDVFISRLRKYFKDDDRVEIMGVHGKGFRLIVG
jgi:DNA-binding response OmpR family regulator